MTVSRIIPFGLAVTFAAGVACGGRLGEETPRPDGGGGASSGSSTTSTTPTGGASTSTGASTIATTASVTATGFAASCLDLKACCETLPPAEAAMCAPSLSLGSPFQCADFLTMIKDDGLCGGTSTSAPSGSTSTGGSTLPTGTCKTLEGCCMDLDSAAEVATCMQYVAQGNPSVCANEVAAYVAMGVACGEGSGSGSSVVGPPACAALNDCCSTLPVADQSSCEEVVTDGNAANCDTSLETLEANGFCGKATGSSGTGSSGSTGLVAACQQLSFCCAAMDGSDKPVCDAIVAEDNAEDCAQALDDDMEAGLCGASTGSVTSGSATSGSASSGDVCSQLAQCCPSLPSPDQAPCQEVSDEGVSATCASLLNDYGEEGYCGGNGSSSTGASGVGCGTLAACCPSLPAGNDMTECEDIVSMGDGTQCVNLLESIQAEGYCQGGETSGGGSATAGSSGS